MTNQQLYLLVGLPTVTALIGILVNVGYFVWISSRFQSTENRIASLESRMDVRINSLETRLDNRIGSLEAKFDILTGKVIELDNRLVRLEERLSH